MNRLVYLLPNSVETTNIKKDIQIRGTELIDYRKSQNYGVDKQKFLEELADGLRLSLIHI